MFLPGTFFGIEIGRRGLQASQRGLNVVSHNLTNASTPGYTRQDAVLVASDPYCRPIWNKASKPGQLGTGVEVPFVRRYRDQYLDNQWREVASAAGYWTAMNEALTRAEAVFPEPDEEYGLQVLIGDFFNTWSDMNNEPGSGVQAAVVAAGFQLATTISQAYAQLDDVRQNVDSMINEKVERINSLTQQIVEVTDAIAYVIFVGEQPNDLLDKRDLLLDELGTLGKITVEASNEGYVSVSLFGTELVAMDNSKVDITRADAEVWAANNQENGMLLGYIDGLAKVEEYMGMLDTLALGIVEEVNAIHNTDPPEVDYPDFFVATGAADLRLSDEMQASETNINPDVGLAIFRLREKMTMLPNALGENTLSFEGYYRALTTKIGADTEGSISRLGTQTAVMKQINDLRDSVISVSTDEELTKMIQFQYAYQAASRIVTVMDELLDTLINRTAV